MYAKYARPLAIACSIVVLMIGTGIVTLRLGEQRKRDRLRRLEGNVEGMLQVRPLGDLASEHVAGIQFELHEWNEAKKAEKVPSRLVEEVFHAFESGYVDDSPLKWACFAIVVITADSGEQWRVNVYCTRTYRSAYSIGKRYYRGESEADLLRLLRDCAMEDNAGLAAPGAGRD